MSRFVIALCAVCFLFTSTVLATPYRVREVSTHRKVVALTFDDAPNDINTLKLIEALKRMNVKATWFLVGKHVREYPDISRQIKAAGFEIGNHSQAHIDYSKMSQEDLEKDIMESQLVFYDVLGMYPDYFRPPYGRIRTESMRILKRYYHHVIGWSVDPRDWDLEVSDLRALNTIYNNVRPGAIILCHDKLHGRILRILPDIVEGLRRKGYAFVTVSELLNMADQPSSSKPGSSVTFSTTYSHSPDRLAGIVFPLRHTPQPLETNRYHSVLTGRFDLINSYFTKMK